MNRHKIWAYVALAVWAAACHSTGEGPVDQESLAPAADQPGMAAIERVPEITPAPRPPEDSARQARIEAHRQRIREIIEERRLLQDPQTIIAVRQKAGAGQDYDFGQIVSVELEKDQAVRLLCGENPYGMREFLIASDDAKHALYLFEVATDGSYYGRMKEFDPSGSMEGSPKAAPSVRDYLKWEIRDGKIALWFQAKGNEEFGHEVTQRREQLRKDITEAGADVGMRPTPGPDGDAAPSSAAIRAAIEKRRELDTAAAKDFDALVEKYDMGPDW